jgi:carbamoyl-phosphate synthase large subunit
MRTVMVTGVGAIIGYGVLRSLRADTPGVRLIGSDIYPDAVGRFWCDEFVVAPYTSDPCYSDWLSNQISRYNVDLVVPAIEQDVDFLSDNRRLFSTIECKVVLNAEHLIEIARDKWAMDRELLSIAEPSRIHSLDQGVYEAICLELGSPFLLKPRRGYASKGIVRVSDEATFEVHAASLGNELIAQEIVGSNDHEYTVSVFGDGGGDILALSTLRRRLAADGSTSKAVSVLPGDAPGLEETVIRLVEHFRPEGPTNLQFRQTDEGWKLLEINPRISSSTSIRTAFGYNEASMSYDYYLNGVLPAQPQIKPGSAERYIEEVVVIDRHFV